MKKKSYLKSLVAPLSMLMVFACAPDQYHQQGEYDDVYFTKNDRQQQPAFVPSVNANPSVVTQNASTGTIPAELQEKYTNQSEVVYYEEQGPRVKTADELNYEDFVIDYQNEQLAYYELPLDWETGWSRQSFDELMATDYQFKLAWYDQYYKGQSYRMDSYLGQQNNLGQARNAFYGNSLAANNTFPVYGNQFGSNIMYNTMMPFGVLNANMNPAWGYRFAVGIGFGANSFGWNSAFMNPWYDPFFMGFNRWNNPWNPGWGWGGGIWGNNNNVIINNGGFESRPNVTRSSRMQSTLVTSVAQDSQNGAGVRNRSQRAAMVGATGARSATAVRSSRSGLTRQAVTAGRNTSRTNQTRADLTAGRVNRVSTDQNRLSSSSRGARITRNRVNTSRQTSNRSTNGITSSRGRSVSSMTRADVGRSSSNRSRSGALSFNRNSSSSITRSVANRNSVSRSYTNSRSSSSRSVSGYPSRSNSSNSYSNRSSSRSSGVSRSRGSSSSRSSGVSRSSGSSSSRSSGSSGGSSRSGGSSGSSSRGGRN